MKATTLISLTVGSLLALCTACHPSQSAKEYVVEGVVRDSSANGKTIYIMRYDNNEFIDSTVVKDNRFTFKGQIDTAVFCRIDVTYSEFANFILEGGHIQADLETWSLGKTAFTKHKRNRTRPIGNVTKNRKNSKHNGIPFAKQKDGTTTSRLKNSSCGTTMMPWDCPLSTAALSTTCPWMRSWSYCPMRVRG